MTNYAAAIAIASLIGAIGLGIKANLCAKAFFERLMQCHPDLKDAFPLPSLNTHYGPMRPSYMNYLTGKRHLQLPESELQAAGTHVLKLLYGHAVLFTVCVLSALWWGYLRGA